MASLTHLASSSTTVLELQTLSRNKVHHAPRPPHRASISSDRLPAAAVGVAMVNMLQSTTPRASTPLAEYLVARKPPHRLVIM